MKEKNGFTLVELLAVIAILGLLIGIAVPSTLLISKNIKEKLYESKLKNIEVAVEHYLEDYKDNCSHTNNLEQLEQDLTIKKLVDNNYLKPDNNQEIKNPIDGENLYDKSIKELKIKDSKAINLVEICAKINENTDNEKNQIPGESTDKSTTYTLLYNRILNENEIVNKSDDKLPNLKTSLPSDIFYGEKTTKRLDNTIKELQNLSGLYGAYDWNDKPTYYFRGNVENNYVMFDKNDKYNKKQFSKVYKIKDKNNNKWLVFENETWAKSDCNMNWYKYGYKSKDCEIEPDEILTEEEKPMVWRIVRINGDGTIRLVLDGSIGNYKFNENKTSGFTHNEEVSNFGYNNHLKSIYDNENNKFSNIGISGCTDSSIKTILENWYIDNLDRYDNYLDDGLFISDRVKPNIDDKIYKNNTSLIQRLYKNFSFRALSATEKNNLKESGIYELKIGLLTIEELLMAGVGEVLPTGSVNHSYNDLLEEYKYNKLVNVYNYLNNSAGMTMSPFDDYHIYIFKPATLTDDVDSGYPGYTDDEYADPIECTDTNEYQEYHKTYSNSDSDDIDSVWGAYYCGEVGGENDSDVPEAKVPEPLKMYIGKDTYHRFYIDVSHYATASVNEELSVSPVINLKENIKAKTGTGTKDDPYIVSID